MGGFLHWHKSSCCGCKFSSVIQQTSLVTSYSARVHLHTYAPIFVVHIL
uniref:Uncharacterized protein n=1 Tax=Arundo donax TaxID=35708 RepID=A0A0A9FP31_ARUDO